MGGGRTGPQTSWLTPRCRVRDFPTCSPICRAWNVLPAEATAVWLCGGCRCCLDSSTPLTFTWQIPTRCLCKVLRHWRKSDMVPLSSSPWSEKMPKGAVKQQRCWTRHVGETQRTATTNDHKPRGLQQKCILCPESRKFEIKTSAGLTLSRGSEGAAGPWLVAAINPWSPGS